MSRVVVRALAEGVLDHARVQVVDLGAVCLKAILGFDQGIVKLVLDAVRDPLVLACVARVGGGARLGNVRRSRDPREVLLQIAVDASDGLDVPLFVAARRVLAGRLSPLVACWARTGKWGPHQTRDEADTIQPEGSKSASALPDSPARRFSVSSNVAKASVLVEDLRARGFLVFSLPSGIVDKSSFFDAIRSCLPLDPPVVSNRSWDALSDSLWEGLSELAENRIAIVWPTEEVAAAEDMKIAMGVLDQVARLLADPVATVGKPKELVVVRI